MIIGTGVDIVKIERFAKKQNPRFMERVFSSRERAYIAKKGIQTMAGLFAAKEAVAKALGTGFSGFYPKDIEILHTPKGKPVVKLHGQARRGRCIHISVSISHTATDAVAFAVAQRIRRRRVRHDGNINWLM